MPTPEHQTPAEYQAQRRQQAVTLYFASPEERARFRKLAADAGYSRDFSGWLIQKVIHATSGHLYPPGYVDELKAENSRLRSRLEQARDDMEDYRAQLRALQGERDTAVVLLAGRLPDGEQIIKRYLPGIPLAAAGSQEASA